MTENIQINLSGIILSTLLFENEQSESQYGFLLGSVNEHRLTTVTDADIQKVQINRHVHLSGIFPMNVILFNKNGQINQKKILRHLHDMNNIVGWYHSRKKTNRKLTLREKLIHKELCSVIHIPIDLFALCVLTSTYSDNQAQHTYYQTFYRFNYENFVEMPFHIDNLGEPFHIYKETGNKRGTIDMIIREIKSKHSINDESTIIDKIEKGIQQHIENQLAQLAALDIRLNQLKHADKCAGDGVDQVKRISKQFKRDNQDNEVQSKNSEEIRETMRSPVVGKTSSKSRKTRLEKIPSNTTLTKDKNDLKAKAKKSSTCPPVTTRTARNIKATSNIKSENQ